jgi:DUF4097 and DUF4098 domain-containing protein YvlB
MKTTWIIPLAIVVLWSTGVSAEGFAKTIPSSAKADVSVSTRSGDIRVTGWERNEVKVESDDDVDRFIKVDGDEIQVGSKGDGIDEDLVVHVPGGARLSVHSISGDLKIDGVGGKLKLHTVSGEIIAGNCKGPMTIKAVSGDVELHQVGDDLEVKGVSGNVTAKSVQANMLEVKTVSGEIDLRSVKASQVRLKTVSGNIVLQGSLSSEGSLKASTFSGDASIILPADANFALSAKSRSGSVRSDFDLKVSEKSDSRIEGKAGSGGVDITLSSFSGDLRLKKEK